VTRSKLTHGQTRSGGPTAAKIGDDEPTKRRSADGRGERVVGARLGP